MQTPLVMTEDEYVVVLFLHQNEKTKTDKGNWLAQLYTGHTEIHCELYFPRTQESCSVDNMRPVHMVSKKCYVGLGESWEGLEIPITTRQYDYLYAWCRNQVGLPFDSAGLWCFCLWRMCSPSTSSARAWLCSRLVGHGLRECGVLPFYVNPQAFTPPDLKRVLLEIPGVRLAEL